MSHDTRVTALFMAAGLPAVVDRRRRVCGARRFLASSAIAAVVVVVAVWVGLSVLAREQLVAAAADRRQPARGPARGRLLDPRAQRRRRTTRWAT